MRHDDTKPDQAEAVDAREEGEAKGRAEQQIEIAINLLPLMDDHQIAQTTGLPIEQIKALRAAPPTEPP